MAAIFTYVDGASGGSGRVREEYFDVTFDANYATQGVPVDPNSCGMVNVVSIEFGGQALTTGATQTTQFVPRYDHVRAVIQFFGSNGAAPAALAEMANATNITTFVLRAKVTGF